MSIDRRLREGLMRNARSFEPEVEVLLDRATRRRRQSARRLVVGAAMCLVVAIAVVTGLVRASPHTGDGGMRDVPVAGSSVTDGLVGSWSRRVPRTNGGSGQVAVDGDWTLEFEAAGVIVVHPPAGYQGVVSGVLFDATADSLQTNLFEQDRCSGLALGRYQWSRTGSALSLVADGDACPDRIIVLAGSWEENR